MHDQPMGELREDMGPTTVAVGAEPRQPDLLPVEKAPPRRRRWRLKVAALLLFTGLPPLLVFVGRPVLEESRFWGCLENLKQLGLALNEYAEVNQHLPASAITGNGGRPLLSWRVAILPYLGRQDLYQRFRLDEPWDSPHNLPLVASMPGVFRCPSERGLDAGMTTYRVVRGPEGLVTGARSLFDPNRGVDLREILDGADSTLMVAETGQPVPWTKPDELFFAEDQPLPRFGSRHEKGFNTVFAAGATRFFSFDTDAETLRAVITRDGGEGFG